MSEKSWEKYVVTDRSVKLYIELLGKEFFENIKDANILEIGPGMTEKFAQYLRKKGARVYTLAPSYRSDSQSGHLAAISHFSNRLQKRLPIKRIAGFAQEPSAVGVNFKKIVALFSVPLYLNQKDAERMFKNCVEMLDKNGEAHFIPMTTNSLEMCSQILKVLRERPELMVIEKDIESSYLPSGCKHLIIKKI